MPSRPPRHRSAEAAAAYRTWWTVAATAVALAATFAAVGLAVTGGWSAPREASGAASRLAPDAAPPPTTPPAAVHTTTPATTMTKTRATSPTTSAATPSTRPATTTPVLGGVLARAAVAASVGGRTGRISAAVYDLADGVESTYGPGTPEDTASIVKADILACLLVQAQAEGRALTADELATATQMIEQSDNDSATDLWDEVGDGPGLARCNRVFGMTSTTPGAAGYWGLTTTVPVDQITLLRLLAVHNAVLSDASRSVELDLMAHVAASERWGVTGGVAPGAEVDLKDGWLPLGDDDDDGDGDEGGNWQINSIGWVHGDGRDYLVAVMTVGSPTEAYGIQTITDLSTAVWAAQAPAT